ncbi:hypothetical protein BH23ACT5_BH23ACT5_14100 [soil metagenome]
MWDVGELSTDQLELELTRLESLKTRAAALQTVLIAEAESRQLALLDGSRTMTEWVSARLDTGTDTARRLVTLSRARADRPLIAHRLDHGEIGPERAAAICAMTPAGSEEDALAHTRGLDLAGVARLAARHRRISRSSEERSHDSSYLVIQPTLDESWWRLWGGLTGPAGAVVEEALRQRGDQLPDDSSSAAHRRALALESVCGDSIEGSLPESGGSGGPAVTAFFDFDLAARTGAETGAELAFGPRLGPAALAELVCQGSVRLVGLSGDRPVVTTDMRRTIPPAIRDYVMFRDGACRAPGCRSRNRLQPHHVVHRSHGGGHDPENLVTLCWFHHHIVVHRRGMRIEFQSGGGIRFVLPADSRDPP